MPTVGVVLPDSAAFTATFSVTGQLRANEQVMVHARESGYVRQVLHDIGDRVQAGEVLALLDNPELHRNAQEQLASVQAVRAQFERLERTRTDAPGLVPQQQLDEARAAFDIAKARRSSTEERIAFLSVRAPFTGVITARSIDVGALVQSGTAVKDAQPLFELQAIDPVRVSVPVTARDAAAVRVGTAVRIRFPDKPGLEREAKVSRTSGALATGSGSMLVEIDLPNADGALRPGSFASVDFQTSSAQQGMSLPAAAAEADGGSHWIWLVRNGIVQRVPIRKGPSTKERFTVLEPPLTRADSVIVEGRNLVRPGDRVQPILQN